MKKVLIVEDEILARLGLRQLVDLEIIEFPEVVKEKIKLNQKPKNPKYSDLLRKLNSQGIHAIFV